VGWVRDQGDIAAITITDGGVVPTGLGNGKQSGFRSSTRQQGAIAGLRHGYRRQQGARGSTGDLGFGGEIRSGGDGGWITYPQVCTGESPR